MTPLRSVLAIGIAGALSACFTSETPFLADSDTVRIADGPIRVCSDKDDCSRAEPGETGKGYVILPPPDEDERPIPVRFAPLTDSALGPVWLAEIDMSEDDDRAFIVGVARRAPEYDADGLMGFDLELPWCGDVSPEDRETYGIVKIDEYTCALPSKTSIADYLREAHRLDFDNPDWWEEQN